MVPASLTIRLFEPTDIPLMAAAFEKIGWHKPAALFEQYHMDQTAQERDVYVALIGEQFAGYLTISWSSLYAPFREAGIPEIVDFNVLPEFRRQHIGTALMDRAESEIAKVSSVAGIGVGMTPDYGAAQRMYVLRGYVPDGRGLYQSDHHLVHGERVAVDDDLALFFTKPLK